MSLDAAHRSSIYQKLRPILGDEDANALMSEFPASDAHELVTKDFLRAELAEVRTELADVRSELLGEINGVRSELVGEINGVRGELAALESRLTVRLGSAIAASTAMLGAIGLLS